MFTAIEDLDEIKDSQLTFEKNLKKNVVDEIERFVGGNWGGDNQNCFVLGGGQFWYHSRKESEARIPKFYNSFGLMSKTSKNAAVINCQISVGINGFSGQLAGLFIKDNDGNVLIAHSGKVGGGKKGVGKEAFLKGYYGRLVKVYVPSKKRYLDYIPIGQVNSNRLQSYLFTFIEQVVRFKDGKSTGSIKAEPERLKVRGFTREFEGEKNYDTAGSIKAICNHGPVVNALHKRLTELGRLTGKDNWIDLYTVNENKIESIFEVKTDFKGYQLYSAIGQLIVYSQGLSNPKKYVVFPKGLNADLVHHLKKYEIQLIEYEWVLDEPKFLDSLASI